MGLLSSIFGKDWTKELERAERLLAEGDAVLAHDLARRAARSKDTAVATRAESILAAVRPRLIEAAVAKADAAEAKGDFEDAADWLLSALDHADEVSAPSLEARREALLDRAEELANPFGAGGAGPAGSDDPLPGLDFDTIVSMLRADVGKRYRDRSSRFEDAIVELNRGETELPLEVLGELLDEEPDDPILLFESARARLLTGEPEAAVEQLEAAWSSLGDEPLDDADTMSVPSLWADAAMELEQAEKVAERLAPIAADDPGRLAIVQPCVAAMIQSGRLDDAERTLASALARAPSNAGLRLALARVLAATDRLDGAIEGLEATVGPSCKGGSCSAPGRFLPAIRFLAELHLRRGDDLERAGELMAIVAHSQGGMLGGRDHEILAVYYRATGQDEAAEHAAAEAARLAGADTDLAAAAPVSFGSKRVL